MLEELIKGLDSKGLLVFQILLGKRAMELMEADKEPTPPKKSIIQL